jgi:hypothetical protein
MNCVLQLKRSIPSIPAAEYSEHPVIGSRVMLVTAGRTIHSTTHVRRIPYFIHNDELEPQSDELVSSGNLTLLASNSCRISTWHCVSPASELNT